MGFIWGFICGAMLIYFHLKIKSKVKIGDIIYLKPTGQKCMIEDDGGWGYWFLMDMNGRLIDGDPYHKNLLDKSPPTVQ